MKKLVLFFIFFITISINAQIEYLSYIPMRTYHWNREPTQLAEFHNTEGGNLGIILIRRTSYENNIYTEKQTGIIRNSYGDASIIINQGVGYKFQNNINVGLSVGLATGYEKEFRGTQYNNSVTNEIYYYREEHVLPGIFSNNGIMPVLCLNISLNKGLNLSKVELSPIINISPIFINTGILLKIK